MKFKALAALMLALAAQGCATNSSPTTSAAVDTNDPRACMRNFESSGSFVAGRQFKTFEDFPAKTQSGAFESLVPAVSSGGYQILNANKDAGIISAAQAVSYSRGSQAAPLNVSVRKATPSGVRVEVVFSLAGGLAASTETIQKEFCRIIAAVEQSPDATAAKATGTPQRSAVVPGTVAITAAQQAAIQKSLTVKTGKPALDQQIKSAAPTISEILKLHGCWFFTGGDARSSPLGIYEAPGASTWSGVLIGRPTNLQYHPKDSCVSVARIQGWTMPAANALSFETLYQSEASKETKKVRYTLVKQPDNAWLLSEVL